MGATGNARCGGEAKVFYANQDPEFPKPYSRPFCVSISRFHALTGAAPVDGAGLLDHTAISE